MNADNPNPTVYEPTSKQRRIDVDYGTVANMVTHTHTRTHIHTD